MEISQSGDKPVQLSGSHQVAAAAVCSDLQHYFELGLEAPLSSLKVTHCD